jgi:FkbM family methyltransferase
MIVQRIVSAVADFVPLSMKIALRGKSGSPNRLATAVHSFLNRMPVERYPILTCGGPLKGFRMRVDWQLHRSFAYGTWEPEVVKAVQAHVAEGMAVLDIGAQTGFYALLLAKLVGPTGQVVAFEPLPANLRVLKENVRINGVQNVRLRNQAVARLSAEMYFEFPNFERSLVGGPLLEGESERVFPVQGISLDDYFQEGGRPVQFVKMDIEGAEVDVLKGARRFLDGWHPCMIVELHDMPKYPKGHPAIALLEDAAYQIQWLGEIGITAHVLAK